MPRKKLIEGSYYWVRRPAVRLETPEGASEHPDWEPMLWSGGLFWTRENHRGHKLEEFDKIGDRIPPQGKKQMTKKAWMPLDFDYRGRGNLKPDVDNISSTRLGARIACSSEVETPVRITISWDKATYDKLNQRERKLQR